MEAPAPTVNTTRQTTATTTRQRTVTQGQAVNAADPVVGTDAKGRTIYEGKRGGRYYVNANGNKEYIKKN